MIIMMKRENKEENTYRIGIYQNYAWYILIMSRNYIGTKLSLQELSILIYLVCCLSVCISFLVFFTKFMLRWFPSRMK